MNQTRARIRAWAVRQAMSKADSEALARVTARLRIVKPTPHPGKISPTSVFATAAWAKAVTAQMQGKSFFANFLAADPSNLSGKRASAIIMDDIMDDRTDAMRYAFGAMNIRKPTDFGVISMDLCAG